MIRSYPLLAVFLACPGWLTAAEFLGAEAVLKQVTEASGKEPAKEVSPVETLIEKLNALKAQASSMAAEEAATQWLALLDAFLAVPQELLYESSNSNRLNLGSLIEALPPSQSWDALAASIEKRPTDKHPLREQSLRLLAAVLRDDAAGRKQAIAKLQEEITNHKKIESYERQYIKEAADRISLSLDMIAGDGSTQMAVLTKVIESYENKAGQSYRNNLEIPDLLRDQDEATVAPLIRRALKLDVSFRVTGKATRRLVARLALENLADLKKPVWDLIETEADLSLYEALVKKFAEDNESPYGRQQADTVYLLHLIAKGRTDEAAKLTLELAKGNNGRSLSIHKSDIAAFQQQGFGEQMLKFVKQMLRDQPSLPLWDSFIELSAQQNASDDALSFLREAMARKDLETSIRDQVEGYLASALLAADQVEEGLQKLRERVQRGIEAKPEQAGAGEANPLTKLGMKLSPEQISRMQAMANRGQESPDAEHIAQAIQLAHLGKLLEKPEVVEEAVQAALTLYARLPQQNYERWGEMPKIVELLVNSGRSERAESLLADELAFLSQSKPAELRFGSNLGSDLTAALMWVYHKADRAKDVVALLNDYPFWKVDDLASLANESFEEPVLYMAARALSMVGQKEEARRIVERLVQNRPGHDPSYALLLELSGTDLEAKLDQLQAAHRFEERPLIWKASLQLREGRLDEAERTIRAAIAIDPSDGEKGKGDRMRAYSVLADILGRKGDLAQSNVMLGAVKAIRLSENADDWWNAGLLTRAVAKYEEALLHFADAYCIQSRLALRYSELGDFAKAEAHYKRAFELMPDSFGRVESHCFGCEGAFSGQRAQNIADKVFTALAQQMPEKPQVFYLLGYLRDQQRLYPEAADHYRKAVQLDPDYLNAWKKLLSIADQVRMPAREREHIVLELFRLDPSSSTDIRSLTNLRLLWDAILAAEKARVKPEVGPIYPMPAAAQAMAKDPDAMRDNQYRQHSIEESSYRSLLTQSSLIQETGQLLQMVTQRGY